MAVTVSDVQDLVNQHINDTTTTAISANDRLRAITEACRQAYNEFEFDFTNRSATVNYFDTINYYDVTTDIPDLLEPVDLRRAEGRHTNVFTRVGARDIAVHLDSGIIKDEFSVEVRDRKKYLVINGSTQFVSKVLHNCDDDTDNGTWTLDTTNGDGTNLTVDDVEYKEGGGSLNFDADVSQTVNNRIRIYNSDMEAVDLSDDEDLSSLLFQAYIPDVTEFTGFTGYWGSSTSAYWSASVTTDYAGAAWVSGWNRVKIDWPDTTATGSPDSEEVNFVQIDFNYSASQGDDTDFRLDDIIMARPEKLTFVYNSWAVGVTSTSNSTPVYAFTATTNVPFFSGTYDYFVTYVSHLAASLLFRQLGMTADADNEQSIANKELNRLKRKFPSSRLTESKNFKVGGLNFTK